MAAKTMEQAFKKYRRDDADMSLWKAFCGGWEAAMNINEARPTVRRNARATDKVRLIDDDGTVVPADGYGQHSHPDFFSN